MKGEDLSAYSMDELFRAEAEQQCAICPITFCAWKRPVMSPRCSRS